MGIHCSLDKCSKVPKCTTSNFRHSENHYLALQRALAFCAARMHRDQDAYLLQAIVNLVKLFHFSMSHLRSSLVKGTEHPSEKSL